MAEPLIHTTGSYAEDLAQVREELLVMVGRVENMIHRAGKALVSRDVALARATIELDHAVNRAELEIDARCLELLATHQPLASELRFITLAWKMVTDLERIADLAANICERVIDLSLSEPIVVHADIPQMTNLVRSMVKDAIDGFVQGDAKKAYDVLERDDDVDELYHYVFEDTLALMRKSPARMHQLLHIQAVAKWLERMGDHATNLAEMVIFMVDGRDVRHAADRKRDKSR